MDFAQAWQEVLPEIRNGVTGMGVWTALNLSQPVAVEDGQFVLGLPNESTDLSGHLKMHSTKILIERAMASKLGIPIIARIIDGVTVADWEMAKRKDVEVRRLQQQAIDRAKAEMKSETSWESVYEGLTRKNAGILNKSLPQNRAKFYIEAVELVAEALRTSPITSELDERNFARVLERVAQYADVPSVLVAQAVLEKAVEI